MNKKASPPTKYRHLIQYLGTSLITCLIFIIFNFSYYSSAIPKHGYLHFSIMLLVHASFGNAIISLLLFSRYFYLIFCSIIFCLNCVVIYYKKVYSSHLTTEIVDYILHSDIQGLRDHLDMQVFIWLLLFALVPVFILYKYTKGFEFSLKNYLINWILWIYLFMGSCLVAYTTRFPFETYIGTIGYILPYSYLVVIDESVSQYTNKSTTPKANNFVTEENHKHTNMVSVLVIGESARYDHFSINGYKRPTSPHLEKVQNLISFSKAYSLDTYTSIVVPKIIQNIKLDNHVSLIKLMEKNNYKTLWISNHRKHGDAVTEVASESQFSIFRDDIYSTKTANKFDQAILDKLDETLKASPNENLFIVLHTIGSHLNYDLRYPDEYMIYTPTCKRNYSFFGRDSCTDIENLTNSYDNSITYSDYILAQVIERLKPHNSMLIYVSDHGQSLGENGVYFHGAIYKGAPEEQIHIPMFVWASDQFLKDPDLKNNFKKASSAKDQSFTHATIFHSIPHCLGLQKNIDPSMSICK